MSNRTELKIQVLDEGAGAEVVTQYGMRYPNGTVRWTSDGRKGFDFQRIAEGDKSAVLGWENHLALQAREASIDPQEYVDNHIPIKRTVVLATTAAENVQRTAPAVTPPPAPPFDL